MVSPIRILHPETPSVGAITREHLLSRVDPHCSSSSGPLWRIRWGRRCLPGKERLNPGKQGCPVRNQLLLLHQG